MSFIHRLRTSSSSSGVVDGISRSANLPFMFQQPGSHGDAVSSVVISADSSRLASAFEDNTVKIWDASSGQCLRTLEGHSDLVSSVVFSADSSRLASASYDNTVKIWDASSGQCLEMYEVSFSVIGSSLETDIGPLPLNDSSSNRSLSWNE